MRNAYYKLCYMLGFIRLFLKHGFKLREKVGFRKVKGAIKPYAFIRVCNEIPTIKASLESIAFLGRGVIVYNDCDDGSEEVILEFCKTHKGFKAYKYPYHVKRVHRESEVFPPEYKELFEYYNFALSKIPKDKWLLKIDVDQIYFQDITEESFKLIEHENDVVCYPRVNLHVLDGEVLVNKHIPISDVNDHWLIFNHGLSFKKYVEGGGVMEALALPHANLNFIKSPINSFHFPLLKKQRFTKKREDFMSLDEFKDQYKKDKSKLIVGGYVPLKDGREILDLEFLDTRLPEILKRLKF
ncbi:hypothetical protein [Helicobacter sp. 11S02629-2]|uniref:hypothetical protein n=1 Tax=Helicobacter sp. 11S02629-2 TaxID=1476195 RepID=UPI001C5E8A01|nr:hypothetical protein [Helicobacter sp. 11S02629-2]